LSPVETAAKDNFEAAANPSVAAGTSLNKNFLRFIISPPRIQQSTGCAYDGVLKKVCQALRASFFRTPFAGKGIELLDIN
jgi:hypothetical protein